MDKTYKKFSHFPKNEEFQEEDIWSVLSRGGDTKPKSGSTQKPILIASKTFPSAARMIRGSSSGSGQESAQAAQSAPMNVPDWSGVKGKKVSEGREEEEGEGAMVPPHEWVARKQRNGEEMTSFSVFEGAGRTLKGRDLRKVRYAVLSRTGFLE